jgi:hypothetical protein
MIGLVIIIIVECAATITVECVIVITVELINITIAQLVRIIIPCALPPPWIAGEPLSFM